MGQKEFVATQGLLHDDMRKQAGRIEKSWLEALMNSVDAGATEFKIDITSESTHISDNGSGMSEEDIEMYFRQFGFKDSDVEDKTFGKFRRGRGQIFNFGVNVWHTRDNLLVVNLDDETAQVVAAVDESKSDEDVQKSDEGVYVFKTEGLGYNHQKASEVVDGTKIKVIHYKELDNTADKVSEFRKLAKYVSWLHDIEVYVNNELVDETFNADFETEFGYFAYGDDSLFAEASIYNLGAYVDSTSVKDSDGKRVPISGVIVTKEELDLNNARTEIIEGDKVWEQVEEDYIVGARYNLAQKDDLKSREVKWLIRQAGKDDEIFEMILEREIIEDIKGSKVSLNNLSEEDFAFAPSGNAVAKEAMERKGILMVDSNYADSIRSLNESNNSRGEDLPEVPEGRSYEQVIDEEMTFEMKEWDESKLSKRRKQNLDILRWVLREVSCYDNLKPGHSKHENVWRTDRDTILVDKDYLNANKMKLATEVVDELIKVAAHDGDTRAEFTKGRSYYRSYHSLMSKLGEVRQDILTNNVDFNSHPALGSR